MTLALTLAALTIALILGALTLAMPLALTLALTLGHGARVCAASGASPRAWSGPFAQLTLRRRPARIENRWGGLRVEFPHPHAPLGSKTGGAACE